MMIRYGKPDILAFREQGQHRHGVIEASAGTGKTYTLTHLIVDLLLDPERDVNIEDILVVTFTRRATADLKAQIRKLLTEIVSAREDRLVGAKTHWVIDDKARARLRKALLSFDRTSVFTIHSFCQKILTENAFQNGQLFDLDLVDEEDLFGDCFQDLLRGPFSRLDEYKDYLDAWLLPQVGGSTTKLGSALYDVYKSGGELRRVTEDPDASDLLKLATTIKSSDKRSQYDTRVVILRKLMDKLVEEVQLRKEREGLYTYKDMLSLVVACLDRARAGDGPSRHLVNIVREQYQFALIDEFQDTDPEQWEIFQRLFAEPDTGHGLFIIGDPKQAIYKFRGADVWTYLRAVRELGKDQAPLRLPDNYRSTREMVRAYNHIFDQGRSDAFFSGDEIDYENPVKPNPIADRQVRRSGDQVSPPAITVMHVDLPGGNAPEVKSYWKDWIITEIESLLFGKGKLEVASSEGERFKSVTAGDIYVLTNSNNEGKEIGELMKARGIPHAFYRQEGLWQSLEARDILTLLQAIQEPGDGRRRRAVYRSPFFAVPIRELKRFDEESDAADKVRKMLLDWKDNAAKGQYAWLFDRILRQTGLLRREILFGVGERGVTNYLHLFEKLTEKALSDGSDLFELIAWLRGKVEGTTDEENADEDGNLQRLETQKPAVQIMTMHKSKGLEAEVVFVYGGFKKQMKGPQTFIDSDDPAADDAERVTFLSGSKDYLPKEQRKRLDAQNDWEDERLMYVALTRAKSRLYLCYATGERCYGRSGRHTPLVRALDYIADRDPCDQIEFVELTGEGCHPESAPPVEVSPEKILEAVVSLVPRETKEEVEAERARRAAIRASARQTVSFSGVAKYTGTDKIEAVQKPERAEDEDKGPPDDEDEVNAHLRKIRDDRFLADQSVLTGGARPGSFLHDILEFISDYGSVLDHDDALSWLERPEIRAIFDDQRRKHRIDASVEAYAARVLFDTLRAPLVLPDGAVIDGIARLKDNAREIPFHFPMPTLDIPLGQWPDAPPEIERGWVTGSIDLVFSHEGRVYIADWKSNVQGDYRPEALQPYVDNRYGLQARLYTLATVLMLGIDDEATYDALFGGCAYLFVRGMRSDGPAPSSGVVWCRPPWADVISWYEGLAANRPNDWTKPMKIFTPESPVEELR
ncbi:MAG: UvrD-helicase domain-containing protein [Bradymonadaceae bacterium]